MTAVTGRLKPLCARAALGMTTLICVVLGMAAAGRSFALGFRLLPIYGVFVLAFLIFGRPLRFGVGASKPCVLCSYLIAAGVALLAIYVLWHATDPAVLAQTFAVLREAERALLECS